MTNEYARPLANYKISISFSGFIGTHHLEHTEGDGWAYFKNEYEHEEAPRSIDGIRAHLGLVGGSELQLMSDGSIDNGESLSFTVSDEDFEEVYELPQ